MFRLTFPVPEIFPGKSYLMVLAFSQFWQTVDRQVYIHFGWLPRKRPLSSKEKMKNTYAMCIYVAHRLNLGGEKAPTSSMVN